MLSLDLKSRIFEAIERTEKESDFVFESARGILCYHHELNEEEICSIIDIFIHGLENATLKENEDKWVEENYGYFSGNAMIGNWHVRFREKDFTYSSLIDYVKEIKTNHNPDNFQFSLRNAEVTLRDDVRFDNHDVFMKVCKSVFEDILNEKLR